MPCSATITARGLPAYSPVASQRRSGRRAPSRATMASSVTTALVALVNVILAAVPQVGAAPLTVERILGWLFSPFVWLLGVPWDQAGTAGGLMGIKLALNELIAYLRLAALPAGTLDPRSVQIMVYAMCGFANFASIGILIAGMSALMPERRQEVVALAPRALLAGILASSLSGAMIGLLPL